MSIQATNTILSGDAGVTALVGTRITPLVRTQNLTLPAVTIQRVTTQPTTALDGDAALDNSRMQVDSYAETYKDCKALADTVRRAMQAAGCPLMLELDTFDDDAKLSGIYQITQEYNVWTNFS